MELEAKDRNVFAGRNFRLVFFGALVSELGGVLYNFAVSFYILEITDNNAFLQGLYLALCGVTLLLFTPIGGVLGDRFNKASIMFICDYLRGGGIILATLLMFLLPGHTAHLVILFALGMLGNAIGGIFSPASGALFPNIVDESKLQQANAFFSIKSALLGIAGVLLAGVLYAAMPVILLFLIVGICFVLSGVSEMFIRYDHVAKEEKLTVRVAINDMKEGLTYLRAQKPIMALIISILFVNFFISPIGSNFLPYFVKTELAAAPDYLFKNILTPELWMSVSSMLIGISSLVGSVILSAKPQAEKCGHTTAVRLCEISVVMIGLAVTYFLLVDRGLSMNAFLISLCFGCLALGYLIVSINIPVNTALMRWVEKDKLSKVSSIISIMSQGLTPLASVTAGIVIQTVGNTILLFICALGFTIAALMLLFNKESKKI